MKDYDQKELESGRPNIELLEGLEYCLNALYRDNTKNFTDKIVDGLTYEELIGVLLLAKDNAKLARELDEL
jgi:hypothetical protein